MKLTLLTLWLGLLGSLPLHTHAALIGRALAPAPDLALVATDNPLQDAFSSSGDGFQHYRRGAGSTIPAALLDDGGGDALGIVTRADTNPFFGVVDTLNADNSLTAIARWVFAIGGYQSLQLALGMAAMGDFESSDWFRWHYRLDGGPLVRLFEGRADERSSQSYILSGSTVSLPDPLIVAGVALDNRFQTFTAALPGSGEHLTLELSAVFNGGAEVGAFRNLLISGQAAAVPAPGTLPLLLGCALAVWAIRRRARGSAQQFAD